MLKKWKVIGAVFLFLVSSSGVSEAAKSAQNSMHFATKSNIRKLTFSAITVEGKAFKSSALLGKLPTVLWFWAPWCAICKNESKYILSASKKYQGKVNFIGVGALGSTQEMQVFINETGTSAFTNIDDHETKIWGRFGVFIQPTLVFVDSLGKITSQAGPSDEKYLNNNLKILTSKQ